jgi:SAM-dependent methyltransferase
MPLRKPTLDPTKRNGVHYTPEGLAHFLAELIFHATGTPTSPLRVLDPACGAGGLLYALANAAPLAVRRDMILEGYETDPAAIARARFQLSTAGVADVVLHNRDFLAEEQLIPFDEANQLRPGQPAPRYDLVIANPPYVRTQVLGAGKAKSLARKFGLSGRVDLAHAFVMGMASVLKTGGILGLLTSNRFLTIKSGAALRQLFRTHFHLQSLYDLGDTKLFAAAVLPLILIGRKGHATQQDCVFHRIYARRATDGAHAIRDSILTALRDRDLVGNVQTPTGSFRIERGQLAVERDTWSLVTTAVNGWLETVRARQVQCFGDLGKVRVGIKSTADEVFIRHNWDNLPSPPEKALLRPLLTHHIAARWLARPAEKQVLYPHSTRNGRRVPIDLKEYPRAAAYLQAHRVRLAGRTYVIASGRPWYELWVPHNPEDWRKPKIAYPDISEEPRFFWDGSGAVVNGDCYWITLHPGVDPDWLLLMLAVANSTFITRYYDTVFHNKLYAGRRRFMTQYVAKFPLPDLASSQEIVQGVRQVLAAGASEKAERRLNHLVWQSFGLVEEIPLPHSR